MGSHKEIGCLLYINYEHFMDVQFLLWCPGAWIITGGTASGVMEFVGEALRDHMAISSMGSQMPCVALGIAVWGCVANNLALDGEGVS